MTTARLEILEASDNESQARDFLVLTMYKMIYLTIHTYHTMLLSLSLGLLEGG